MAQDLERDKLIRWVSSPVHTGSWSRPF